MQYLFEGGIEVPVIIIFYVEMSKKDLCSYQRTQKRTLNQIKEMCDKSKNVVATLHDEAGGIPKVNSANELPQSRR